MIALSQGPLDESQGLMTCHPCRPCHQPLSHGQMTALWLSTSNRSSGLECGKVGPHRVYRVSPLVRCLSAVTNSSLPRSPSPVQPTTHTALPCTGHHTQASTLLSTQEGRQAEKGALTEADV